MWGLVFLLTCGKLNCPYYARVAKLLTRGKHLHDCIISLKGKFWVHITSLTPPRFIVVSVPSQESERSCICVLGVTILLFDFWNYSNVVVLCVFHLILYDNSAFQYFHYHLDLTKLDIYIFNQIQSNTSLL
jgi:hypothetical protein